MSHPHPSFSRPSLSPPGSGSSSSPSPSLTQWESLRKKSRLLETQIYKKLQEFSQIQTTIMNEGRGGKSSNSRVSRVDMELEVLRPAAAAATSPMMHYEACVGELTSLMRSFNDITDSMGRLLSESPSLGTDSNAYIVSKSRTVAHENSTEFHRTQQNIQAAIARSELMGGSSRREADQSLRPRTEQLLREEHSLHQSLRLTDEALSSAVAARDSLFAQGAVFTGVGQKLTKLGTMFPIVGQLMNRIGCKQQRDTIVMACVIATCIILIFLYIMSKP